MKGKFDIDNKPANLIKSNVRICIKCKSQEATCKFLPLHYQPSFKKWENPLKYNLGKDTCDGCRKGLRKMFIFKTPNIGNSTSETGSENSMKLPKATEVKEFLLLISTTNKNMKNKKINNKNLKNLPQ